MKSRVNHPLRAATVAAVTWLAWQGGARAQTPIADYQFQGNLNNSTGSLGALTEVGSGYFTYPTATVNGQSQEVLNVSTGGTAPTFTQGGVQTPANPFTNAGVYSIVLEASFTISTLDVLATKVFDFKDLTTDAGLYVNDATGALQFINNSSVVVTGGTGTDLVATGTYFQLSLTRSAAGLVTCYENATQEFQFDDSTSQLATLSNVLTLFKDDGTGVGGSTIAEGTVGDLAELRLYDSALTQTQIGALVPEPGAWVPLTGGIMLLVTAAFHRRRAVV